MLIKYLLWIFLGENNQCRRNSKLNKLFSIIGKIKKIKTDIHVSIDSYELLINLFFLVNF